MRSTQLPDDYALTDSMRTWAEKNVPQVKVEKEFEKFCDYFWASGKTMVNWDAALRGWLRRCIEFKGACLYTKDELRLKDLAKEYMANGFRKPMPHENSTMYEFEYRHWKNVKDRVPIRDMSVVRELVKAKTA